MFLRGYGSQSHSQSNGSTIGTTSTTHSSGNLGEVQGDANRDIWGNANSAAQGFGDSTAALVSNGTNDANNGAFVAVAKTDEVQTATTGRSVWQNAFHSSRVVPTSTENRPANVAVNYLIKAY